MSRPSYISSPPKVRSVLIKNARFLISEKEALAGKSLFIEDRKVVAIGDFSEIRKNHGSADEEVDASDCIIMPGLVNNHSHIAMSLLRGYAEDLPLMNWLKDKIWPAEAKLKPADIYLGAAAGATEALLSGTTSITSIYFYSEAGSEAHAAYDVGIRGLFAHGVFDWTREESLKRTEEMVAAFHGRDEGRIRVATSPHSPYTCSPELLKEIEAKRLDLNEKYGEKYRVMNTIHVSEARTEASEIESKYKISVKNGVAAYLDSLGVLSSETIAAHCIHLTAKDIFAMKARNASIASCPVSNLKIGMGVADLPKYLSNGITVSLGTDGPASNNTLDMFETMKMASLLPKGLQGDTTLMDSRQSFELATLGGAKSMRREEEIGTIAIGKRADIVILDLKKFHSIPFYDPFSHLLFSAKSEDVRDVLVDGRILVRNRKILAVDYEKMSEQIENRVVELGLKESTAP